MGNIEKINDTYSKPLFELKKEGIYPSMFDINLELFVGNYFLERKDIGATDKNQKITESKDKILKVLLEKSIAYDSILSVQIFKNGKLYIFYGNNGKKERLTFDLEKQENIFLGELDELKQKKQIEIKKSIKLLEKGNNILLAMDEVFTRNDKEWFGEINDEDILKTDKYGKSLLGLNLKQLQAEFKESFDEISLISKEDLPSNITYDILRQEKKYLSMIMGIGNKYEGGVAYLKEEMGDYNMILNDIVNYSSFHSLLYYLKEVHRKIDANNYQSTNVERAYDLLSKDLHKKILDRLIKENRPDKDFLFFAKIITGRGRYHLSSDIDSNLKDQNTANEALLYMMNRQGGIIEQLGSEFSFEDKEISNKKPKSIIDDLKNNFYLKFGRNLELQKTFYKTLKISGYEDVLNINDNESYSDLSFVEKTKLAVLYRVGEKLNSGKGFLDMVLEVGGNLINFKDAPFDIQKSYMLSELNGVFSDVALSYREELTGELESKFGSKNPLDGDFWVGKKAKELGLTGKKAEAFDLFQDMNGNGILDLSDTSIERLKTGGKFVGVIAVGIAAPLLILPAAGVVAQGAAAGFAATVASMAINPHGYDTVEEAAFDISTDLIVGTSTGVLGGYLVKWKGVEYLVGKDGSRQILTKELKEVLTEDSIVKSARYGEEGFITNNTILATDLIFLGLGPEIGRQKVISELYHGEPFLVEKLDN